MVGNKLGIAVMGFAFYTENYKYFYHCYVSYMLMKICFALVSMRVENCVQIIQTASMVA